MLHGITEIASRARGYETRLWLALMVVLVGSSAAQAADCESARYLDLDTSWRSATRPEAQVEHWRLDVPSAGVLVAEIAVGNGDARQAMLDLDSAVCGPRGADYAVLEGATSRLVLAITEPGRLLLRASTVDPRVALGTYKVFTHFVPLMARTDAADGGVVDGRWRLRQRTRLFDTRDRLIVERVALEGSPPWSKTEMEEIDPNPAGAKRLSQAWIEAAWLAPTLQATEQGRVKTEMEEIDPNPAGLRLDGTGSLRVWVTLRDGALDADLVKTEIEEIDPNPAGVMSQPRPRVTGFPLALAVPASPNRLTRPWPTDDLLRQLTDGVEQWLAESSRSTAPVSIEALLGACARRDGDDHHDAFGCATWVRMGALRTGTLSPEALDDTDTFGFTVRAASRIVVRVASDEILSVALHDRSGRRLSPGAVEGTDMRMIEVLEPGRYILRLEARELSPTRYRLMVRTLDS